MADAPAPPAARDQAERLRTADQLGLQLVRFLRLSHHAKQHIMAGAKPAIERSNYALLATLVKLGPLRATALADALRSDPSTVSRQVSALVGQGLVRREPDPEDGRACVLAPTDEGSEVFRANHEHRTRLLAELLDGWSTTDQQALVRLLTRLNTEFENHQGEPA
ncbi:MarR family winged helix-turn-helix transcriptional regulator [Actinokineospora bangkokensis]|uniref:MarR family transcriptional regulator n=1 Tax=Actinokineospora bangkokensis TaxID=1193682 RepID=A0A1Q9LFY5_9PSEU|nr:MarR family transcriptional regulator [Actinokineospora bangkokensis]OLR90930.1 MarR family transcriptional regulator [Actinokineospora bangkokensis]